MHADRTARPRPWSALLPLLAALGLPGPLVARSLQAGLDPAPASAAASPASAQEPGAAPPAAGRLFLTAPEASGFRRTSRLAEVESALEALKASPFGEFCERLQLGYSAGRGAEAPALPLLALRMTDRKPGRLRVLVLANIHGGEVEGKEASLMLMRELAEGRHRGLLERLELLWIPVYNPDGNEAIGPWNRVEQNGPEEGVGERANGLGLDLNRDLIKAEAPETRALLGILARFNPHLLLDLHTTNGTDHGYPLTYATSLTPGLDADLSAYAEQRFLPAVAARMAEQGFSTFDYGNLESIEGGGEAWRSFDARPRFLTNYIGLRNRIPILSEAFSYADFGLRIEATRAFVLACLERAAEEAEDIRRRVEAADRRCMDPAQPLALPLAVALEPPWPKDIWLQRIEELELSLPDGGSGRRRQATWELERRPSQAQVRFLSTALRSLPAGWAVAAPNAALLETLAWHGVDVRLLERPWDGSAERFEISESRLASRPFQGHRERSLRGAWNLTPVRLPAGALVVPRAQPLARLAAWLLEPESLDSWTTWNGFDAWLAEDPSHHPVLRLAQLPD